MNLQQLLNENDILFVNHFRITLENSIGIFYFDKTVDDYSIYISIDDITEMNKRFNEDFTNNLLLLEDEPETIKDSIIIFSSITKYHEYEKRYPKINLERLNIKYIVLNNKINSKISGSRRMEIINIPFNYFDRLIPIILFEDEDKRNYVDRILSLSSDSDHVVYPSVITTQKNVHFVNIPTINQLNEVRSILTDSSNLFFYIKYTNDGDIGEDGIKYNKLLNEINFQTKITYDKKLRINSNGIYYE